MDVPLIQPTSNNHQNQKPELPNADQPIQVNFQLNTKKKYVYSSLAYSNVRNLRRTKQL